MRQQGWFGWGGEIETKRKREKAHEHDNSVVIVVDIRGLKW